MQNFVINIKLNEKSPCLNCPDRHCMCHVDCKKYNTWKVENERIHKMKHDFDLIQNWTANKINYCKNHYVFARSHSYGISPAKC